MNNTDRTDTETNATNNATLRVSTIRYLVRNEYENGLVLSPSLSTITLTLGESSLAIK